MAQTKEIFENFRKRVDIQQGGKGPKLSLNSPEPTSPQSGRLHTNGRNSKYLLSFPETVDQYRLLKKEACNRLLDG